MRAFDEDMAASSSSVSSKPKRERDSPSKKALLGMEVRILSLRKGAILLPSVGVPDGHEDDRYGGLRAYKRRFLLFLFQLECSTICDELKLSFQSHSDTK